MKMSKHIPCPFSVRGGSRGYEICFDDTLVCHCEDFHFYSFDFFKVKRDNVWYMRSQLDIFTDLFSGRKVSYNSHGSKYGERHYKLYKLDGCSGQWIKVSLETS